MRRFEELSDEEVWALRYQLIVLVEALVSMCMRLARRRWGLVHNVDFLIYGADIGEAFRV